MDYDVINDSIWKDYNNTKLDLNTFFKDLKHYVKCKPKYKVIEDTMIVGIITHANAFIKIMQPEPNKEDELKPLPGYNYNSINKSIIEEKDAIDDTRKSVIDSIKLENEFYNAYVNTIKFYINQNENIKIKQEIINIINSKENNNNSYDKLYNIINSISEDLFEFIYDEEILKNINEVNVCTDENRIFIV